MKKILTKKSLIVTGLVIAALATAAGALYMRAANNQSGDTNEDSSASPPTAEEQAAGNQQKANLPDQTEPGQQAATSTSPKNVKPVITSWGQADSKVQVASRVPGVLEDGGTCTLTMSRGGKSVSSSRKGVSNVSEVSCGYISIAVSSLSPGDWTAKISYSSAKAKGVSEPVSITVQ